MPTYSYQCKNCGDKIQRSQSMSDEPLTECNVCSSKSSLVRIISGGTGLIFKGKGFYKTDYIDDNSKNNETNESKKTKENKKG